MFVLDDGWFGKRDNDWCALGDWKVYEEKIKVVFLHWQRRSMVWD